MGIWDFDSLAEHEGHELECVFYGSDNDKVNVAVECITCGSVLVDYDKYPSMDEEDIFLANTLKKLEDLSIALSVFEINMERWLAKEEQYAEEHIGEEGTNQGTIHRGMRAGLMMAWNAYFEAKMIHEWVPGGRSGSDKGSQA